MRRPRHAFIGLALLAPGLAWAQTGYRIQPIAKLGDTAGDTVIKRAGGDFEIGTLNDSGQLVFVTENQAGGEMLVQYADGKLTPIVVSGKEAPGGTWARGGVYSPASMNQNGNIAFAADIKIANKTSTGTFLWDLKTQKLTAVALKGMPAVNNLTLADGGSYGAVINDSGDVAFPAPVNNAAGQAKNGVFFLGRDGHLVPVALPDQELPDGRRVVAAVSRSLNEAGAVALQVRRDGDLRDSAYLWEKGTLTPLVGIGMDAPGGGKFTDVLGVWVNNQNRNVLVYAQVGSSGGPYLFEDGKLRLVAVPGQEMPGGGKLKSIAGPGLISFPNEAGQHAFYATLEDNTTAAYQMDADGRLSLILKSSTQTELGTITRVGGSGLGLNSRGQVALTVRIEGGVDTIVLLTPAAP